MVILRPGGITLEALQEVAGEVTVRKESDPSVKSPGLYPQHYSPKAEVILVDESEGMMQEVKKVVETNEKKGLSVGILSTQENVVHYKDMLTKTLGPRNDGKTCAQELFHLLREFDKESVDVIVAESISEQGLGLAVMNRLRKAAG